MSDLKTLCCELAALDPNWPKPGMRCVDPETGRVWRKDDTADFWVGVIGLYSVWASVGVSTADYGKSISRAIAAGPDPTDDATIGALLLGIDYWIQLRFDGESWQTISYLESPSSQRHLANHGADKDEAIIRAAIAVKRGVK